VSSDKHNWTMDHYTFKSKWLYFKIPLKTVVYSHCKILELTSILWKLQMPLPHSRYAYNLVVKISRFFWKYFVYFQTDVILFYTLIKQILCFKCALNLVIGSYLTYYRCIIRLSTTAWKIIIVHLPHEIVASRLFKKRMNRKRFWLYI